MTPSVASSTATPVADTTQTSNHVPKPNGVVKPTDAKRIDLEKLVIDFQRKLGENWDRYQSALCLFLLGKLSRQELTDELAVVLDKQTTRMHNQLLLLNLANSLRDSPTVGISSVGFGGPLSKKQKRKTSSQYEKIKKDIMALPPRERRRLTSIQRDSGKKQMVTSTLTMTRQELLPKIPQISKHNNNGSTPSTDVRINNTLLWNQEILQGISTFNSSESYEMPDLDSLSVKMTLVMREHGLIGKINRDATKLMLLGLETHLRSIMESTIDVVRYRKKLYASDELLDAVSTSTTVTNSLKKNRKVVVTLEDMFDTFEQLPQLVDIGGPLMRLSTSLLRNDDDLEDDIEYSGLMNSDGTMGKIADDKGNGKLADNGASSKRPLELEVSMENKSNNEQFGTRKELGLLLRDILASS